MCEKFLFFLIYFGIDRDTRARHRDYHMVNVTNILLNVSTSCQNGTVFDDHDDDFKNRYVIVGLILACFLWILAFKVIYYWFVRDLTGLMIWPNTRELYRRLQLQTSNDANHTNGLNAWSIENTKPVNTQREINNLLMKSENGKLHNTYNSYADDKIHSPQIVTVVPTPSGNIPVVEAAQIYDESMMHANSSELGGYVRKRINRTSNNKNDTPAKKERTTPNYGRDKIIIEDDADIDYFTQKDTADRDRGDTALQMDEDGDSFDSLNYKNQGCCACLSKIIMCDQYRTKSKKKCCPCTLNFSSIFSKSSSKKANKNRPKDRWTDYERTVEDPNDALSVDVNDRKRFWRGTFLVILCDTIVVMSLILTAIGVYLSMDVELDRYFSTQNIAIVFATFKLTELSGGLIGYISIMLHATLYRGDIVKIVGTWAGIGGYVRGVVLDVNISDVLLLVNTPFVSHFSEKSSEAHSKLSKIKAASAASIHKQKECEKSEKSKTNGARSSPPSPSPSGIGVKRFIPLHTANSMPKFRNKMTEEDLKELAKSFGGKYVKAEGGGAKKTRYSETIAYIQFDQDDVTCEDYDTYITMQRTANEIEIVRLNTTMVYGSVISRKLGFETNVHVMFEDVF